MLINLTDVLTSEDKKRTEDVELEMTSFSSRMGDFELVSKSPVHLELSSDQTGRALLRGHVEVVQKMVCDRCLSEVTVPIEVDFERYVYAPDNTSSEIADDTDLGVMEGYQLNVEVLVYNELLMNQPEKVLCKPDCKGICMKCGQDLNVKDCGCDTFVPDPRFAGLQDIFNAYKEV